MEARNIFAASLALVIMAGLDPALADHRPVIAVPGHPQVPVIIEGVDATYAYVEGEWGLYAPGRVAPTIIGPGVVPRRAHDPGYYPATGQRPRYGRREVIGQRHGVPPPTFHRSWSAASDAGRVTEYPPYHSPEVSIELGREPRDDPQREMRRRDRRRVR